MKFRLWENCPPELTNFWCHRETKVRVDCINRNYNASQGRRARGSSQRAHIYLILC